jgi:hypothetical protein
LQQCVKLFIFSDAVYFAKCANLPICYTVEKFAFFKDASSEQTLARWFQPAIGPKKESVPSSHPRPTKPF